MEILSLDRLRAQVHAQVAQFFSLAESRISDDSILVNDLYADSLDLLDLVLKFNESYQVDIAAKEVESMCTVGDIVRILHRLISQK